MITFLPTSQTTTATLVSMGDALVEATQAAHSDAIVLAETATTVYGSDPNQDTAAVQVQAIHHLIAIRIARAFIRETVLTLVLDTLALVAPTQGNLYHAQRMLEKGQDALRQAARANW